MLTDVSRNVRRIAEECHLQQSGELSVSNMFDAWQISVNISPKEITESHILTLAHNIEPLRNAMGYRTCDVRVGSYVAPPHAAVPGMMNVFVRQLPEMTPGEVFYHFETIHPFRDGNGRTGYLLFNLLNGTIRDLVPPPNYWRDPYRPSMSSEEKRQAVLYSAKYRS